MSIFSERLKSLREKKGFTQKEMGEKLGLSGPSYSKYEYGLREPNLETLSKLPDIFGESLDFILGVTDFDEHGKRMKLEYEYSFMNVLRAQQDILTMEIDPHDKELKKFITNPDDPEEIKRHIENRKKYINNWQKRLDISKGKLLEYLKSIPMVSDKAYAEIKEIEEWQTLMDDAEPGQE